MSGSPFRGRSVLITGGLGFLGSNLAIRLVAEGAEVTLLDALMPEYGGNLFNIEPVRDRVKVNISDVRDEHATSHLVRGKDWVFHFAGQNDHVLSLTNPFPDIEINITGTAVLMEALRKHNPSARVVYSGTRGQYGGQSSLPVREDAPTNPRGLHEVSMLTAEKIILCYQRTRGIPAVLLRLANLYGERAQMKHNRFGVANWFVRLALDDQELPVFGDGGLKRDFVYIGDAIDAILATATDERCDGEILNVGDPNPSTFLELARTIVRVAGQGRWALRPFSEERARQEPGDFYSDISKISSLTGWRPTTPLAEGIGRTLDYYRRHRDRYWTVPT